MVALNECLMATNLRIRGSHAQMGGSNIGPSKVARATEALFILKTGNDIMKNGNHIMKNVLCSILVLVSCVAVLASTPDEQAPKAQYD